MSETLPRYKNRRVFIASAMGMVLGSATTFLVVEHRKKSSLSTEVTAQLGEPSQPIYSCSMHPSIISHEPGKCPICGMPLHLVEHPKEGQQTGNEDESLTISKEQRQNIGVTSAKVSLQSVVMNLRIVGRVAFDPELYTAVEELRQAASLSRAVKDPTILEPIRTKLRLLGLSNQQIKSIEADGSAGIGKLLPQGETWIYAEVFENDLPYVQEGQVVEITGEAIPGERLQGKVKSLSPTANPLARTVRARIQVPDAGRKLRPDSVVDVVVKINHGQKLTVPADAVMYSSQQSLVYVETGEGTYTPRGVILGPRVEALYEVVSGLVDGDRVLTSANFLVDSESRIRRNIETAQRSLNERKQKDHEPTGAAHD